MHLVAGIDIGGTNTRIGLVNKDGEVYSRGALLTADYSDPKEFVKEVSEIINILLKEHPDYKLIGLGIGAPNGNFFKGTIELAPNLRWKDVVPLARYFHDKLKVPAVLNND